MKDEERKWKKLSIPMALVWKPLSLLGYSINPSGCMTEIAKYSSVLWFGIYKCHVSLQNSKIPTT